jgi:phospholipase C
MQEFLDALDSGTLPSVAFVDGGYGEDDHPASDLQVGEAWVRNVYQHAVASPQWLRLAIIWTYDEGGGFADHVPPVPAPCPLAGSESSSLPMGPRVPLVAISPWARRNFASHVVHDHTAIARLVEVLFDLPALTARDANSDALLDLFDFSCGRDLTVLAAPPAGAAGCR